MNILPKKSWHVRNRENIARVRKDEAEAAEKEKEIEARKRKAEQEAKIEFMRKRTQQKYGSYTTKVEPVIYSTPAVSASKLEHVNFFKDLEEGAVVTNAKNKDHEQEVKEEKEKYEKQIGYLTYLGQDTNEADGKVSWYEKPRSNLMSNDDDEERDTKKKCILDPIHKYKHFFHQHRFVPKPANDKPNVADMGFTSKESKKKRKKHKKDKSIRKKRSSDYSSSSTEDEEDRRIKKQKLIILREKRLQREKEEKARADKLLAKMRGEVVKEPVKEPPPQFVQKYNSQFNPHLAKQNATK